jgi:hypothetical protein
MGMTQSRQWLLRRIFTELSFLMYRPGTTARKIFICKYIISLFAISVKQFSRKLSAVEEDIAVARVFLGY